MNAIRNGDEKAVRELLVDGADVNAMGNSLLVERPLSVAIEYKDPSCVKTLLELGADPNYNGSQPALIMAVIHLPQAVPLLLRAGASVDRGDQYGDTALSHAVTKYDAQSARLILEARADPDKKNDGECAPLGYACMYGTTELVELLCFHGADRDDVDGDSTAEEVADRSGHEEILQWLHETKDWKPHMFVGAMTVKDARASVRKGTDPDLLISGKTQRELALEGEVAPGVRDVFERAPKRNALWSREAHFFFADRVRERARAVLGLGALLAVQPRFVGQYAALVSIWEMHVMPHAVRRFPCTRTHRVR